MRIYSFLLLLLPLQLMASDWHGLNIGEKIKGDVKFELERRMTESIYSTHKADFNFDGKAEIIVSYLCGNAGCENLIFSVTNDQEYMFIGSAFFHLLAFEVIVNEDMNYGDILSYQRMSAIGGCLFRYNYRDNGYTEKSSVCGESNLSTLISPKEIDDYPL